jgi:hypothetical protein
LDGDAGGRISTSKVDANTTVGPTAAASKPLNFGQGSFIFVGKAVPLANPL